MRIALNRGSPKMKIDAESYEVFRKIWRQDKVTADTRFRPPLTDAEVWPRPYQRPIRVWHGSATSKESVDLAARYGDPLFSANVTTPMEPYAELIRHYRERWIDRVLLCLGHLVQERRGRMPVCMGPVTRASLPSMYTFTSLRIPNSWR